mmetsp:Transcript_20576/g.46041  ORF Transcript_20576/g.46041 Transcript_20576/m.46041 type:complete len:247 (-) Transcript_20576:366-1106(-)|eukprot:CAMPEP_0173327944 /NCGR_PEP_ID=MMETSP1144-20121109/1888_1 /TAXON_ID=483371 /ORGANISM="non described non described, Strain CCMP2298" /LENGTH=246 /DNA_ID=CAMNT_0014272393 /DNA_START=1 /DNA_END=741 /DNA_ORIENTATION=-
MPRALAIPAPRISFRSPRATQVGPESQGGTEVLSDGDEAGELCDLLRRADELIAPHVEGRRGPAELYELRDGVWQLHEAVVADAQRGQAGEEVDVAGQAGEPIEAEVQHDEVLQLRHGLSWDRHDLVIVEEEFAQVGQVLERRGIGKCCELVEHEVQFHQVGHGLAQMQRGQLVVLQADRAHVGDLEAHWKIHEAVHRQVQEVNFSPLWYGEGDGPEVPIREVDLQTFRRVGRVPHQRVDGARVRE